MSVAVKQKLDPEAAVAPAEKPSIELELVAYKRYHRGGALYEAEVAYRFTEAQATILLREVDPANERPVWRRYRPKPVVQHVAAGTKPVVDARLEEVREQVEDTFVPLESRRIEVGSDEEIADILADTRDSVSV